MQTLGLSHIVLYQCIALLYSDQNTVRLFNTTEC